MPLQPLPTNQTELNKTRYVKCPDPKCGEKTPIPEANPMIIEMNYTKTVPCQKCGKLIVVS